MENCVGRHSREAPNLSHLSDLALQVLDGVQLPLPAVLRSHLVLAAAPDVPTQLGLDRQTSRLWCDETAGDHHDAYTPAPQ